MNFLVALLLASGAFADWHDIKSKEFELESPPAEHSRAYDMDFKILHQYEKKRSAEECALAGSMSVPTVKALFGSVLSQSELNDAKDLFSDVFKFTERVSDYFKVSYHRVRPYNTDTTLNPCIKKPGGAKAYPSSHSAMGTAGACLLAKAFPNKAKALRTQGDRIGELRVLGGVHHPSDVEAGRDLGRQICKRLLKEKDFVKELEDLR